MDSSSGFLGGGFNIPGIKLFEMNSIKAFFHRGSESLPCQQSGGDSCAFPSKVTLGGLYVGKACQGLIPAQSSFFHSRELAGGSGCCRGGGGRCKITPKTGDTSTRVGRTERRPQCRRWIAWIGQCPEIMGNVEEHRKPLRPHWPPWPMNDGMGAPVSQQVIVGHCGGGGTQSYSPGHGEQHEH